MTSKSKPVTVIITSTIKPGMMKTAIEELKQSIANVLSKEKACHGINVHTNPEQPQRLLIIEHWESKEIFLGPHMQTPHMKAFLKTAETFLDGPAEFNFWYETIIQPVAPA